MSEQKETVSNVLRTRHKPIAASLTRLGHDAVLDGEIVVLDREGKAQFQLLQNHATRQGVLVYVRLRSALPGRPRSARTSRQNSLVIRSRPFLITERDELVPAAVSLLAGLELLFRLVHRQIPGQTKRTERRQRWSRSFYRVSCVQNGAPDKHQEALKKHGKVEPAAGTLA